MDNASKAALLSALVFPGAGQIYLKKIKRGIALLIPVGVCLFAICFGIIKASFALIKKMPVEKGNATFAVVLKLFSDAVQELNFLYLALPALLIIAFWIFSIIDAYLLGKKQLPPATIAADQESTSPQT